MEKDSTNGDPGKVSQKTLANVSQNYNTIISLPFLERARGEQKRVVELNIQVQIESNELHV